MTREEILDYLSDFTVIAEIEEEKADTWIDSYPQLSLGYADFSFQFGNKLYVFRLQGNIPQRRLYFSILNQGGDYLQSFYPLVEFDTNLITNKKLNGARMFFYESKVYYKQP